MSPWFRWVCISYHPFSHWLLFFFFSFCMYAILCIIQLENITSRASFTPSMICVEPILICWSFVLIWGMHPRASQPWGEYEMRPWFRGVQGSYYPFSRWFLFFGPFLPYVLYVWDPYRVHLEIVNSSVSLKPRDDMHRTHLGILAICVNLRYASSSFTTLSCIWNETLF